MEKLIITLFSFIYMFGICTSLNSAYFIKKIDKKDCDKIDTFIQNLNWGVLILISLMWPLLLLLTFFDKREEK